MLAKTKIINFCKLIAPSTFPINYLFRLSNDELYNRVFPELRLKFVNDYNKTHSSSQIRDINFVLMSTNKDDEYNINVVLGDDLSKRTISDIKDSVVVMGRCVPLVSDKTNLVWRVKAVR